MMSNEQRYFDVLTRIAKNHQTAKQLLRNDQYGLEPMEALEMAYENMQAEAKAAIKGRRRPKP
jgi:hypothetical protein